MIASPIKPILMAVLPMIFIYGSFRLTSYQTQPGEVGDVPHLYADAVGNKTGNETASGQPEFKIVIGYHPHCPCTLSAIRNLQRLQVRISNPHEIIAFAYVPGDESDSWIESTNTNEIKRLEKLQLEIDRDGVKSGQFGIKTSGHMLIYLPDGELAFSGGITPGRGHEGDCPASTCFLGILNGQSIQQVDWPIFGCPFE